MRGAGMQSSHLQIHPRLLTVSVQLYCLAWCRHIINEWMSKTTENRENSSTTQSDSENSVSHCRISTHRRLKHTPVTTATSQGPSDSQRYTNVSQAQVSLQQHQQVLSQSASSYLLELPQAVHLNRRTFLRLAAREICTGSHRRRRVHEGKTGWTKRYASAWSWHFKQRWGRFSRCFFQQIGEKSNKTLPQEVELQSEQHSGQWDTDFQCNSVTFGSVTQRRGAPRPSTRLPGKAKAAETFRSVDAGEMASGVRLTPGTTANLMFWTRDAWF